MGAITLEAPVFSVEAALEAAAYGVNRLELCSNFPEGGETPSAGMLKFLKSEVDIPIFVMIRPRGGNFAYSQKELMVMKRDIELLGELGADGFVFGVLDYEGKVNASACETLIRTASEKPCTFHRAFDAVLDQFEALEIIKDLGFQRILTSGGKNTVTEGMDVIVELMKKAEGGISIMPGGGSKPEHVSAFSKTGQLHDIHASCKKWKPSKNTFVNPEVSFSDDPDAFKKDLGVDQETVSQFLAAIESL